MMFEWNLIRMFFEFDANSIKKIDAIGFKQPTLIASQMSKSDYAPQRVARMRSRQF